MQYDRIIAIATGNSRKATVWPQQELAWSDFLVKLSKPQRTEEAFAEYKSWPKQKQDELKDVGGFVGGTLTNGRRKNEYAGVRYLITLDADSIEPGGAQRVINQVSSLGCAYAIYSTRKHEGAAPRLRIIVPLDRACTADEYEAVARKLAYFIDLNIMDPTTFEAVRLMYWPSCSADSEYLFIYEDKPFLSADGMLALYNDWRNVAEWPVVPGAEKLRDRSAKKQGDPLAKTGIVGAFCKIYSIEAAMAEFIPGVYEPCGDNRYTYAGGSTVGGAVTYDDKFIYSHHATDPCSGILCNAFDMVRHHLFSDEDADALPDTPTNRLPSYAKMCEYASQINQITQILLQERLAQATEAFSSAGESLLEDTGWFSSLDFNKQTGSVLNTRYNAQKIMENDSKIKNRMYLDDFSNRVVVIAPLPWETAVFPYEQRAWKDADDEGLQTYMEKAYNITGEKKVLGAFRIYTELNRKNKLKDYLKGLSWDGISRVDRLLIDYFGAEDNSYTRQAIRKCLVAAVKRVFCPGIKFDNMLILSGKQGIGKSTFFNMLGMVWYSDSLSTFEGKDAAELLQGYWIVEAGELTGLNRSEMNDVKQFLSKREDIYRAPYGRRTENYPRRCIIVGTTNDKEFLKDTTGNRRFWPVDLHTIEPVKSVFKDLASEVDQIWAESVVLMERGESLILSEEALAYAENSQADHREINPKEGMIREFLESPIPHDWYKRTASARRDFCISDFKATDETRTTKRDKICAVEIYVECFKNINVGAMSRRDTLEINNILKSMDDWELLNGCREFGPGYGKQRGFSRKLEGNIL